MAKDIYLMRMHSSTYSKSVSHKIKFKESWYDKEDKELNNVKDLTTGLIMKIT